MSVPAAYLGIALLWSTTPLTVQWSAEGVGFLFGITARMAVATALSLLLMGLCRVRLPWTAEAVRGYAAGALGLFGSMTLVYWSALYVPSGLIAVLFGITPLLTGVMGALWLNERSLSASRVGGILLGLIGLAIIFGADLSPYPGVGRGIALLLGAVLLYSLSMVLVKRNGAEFHPLAQSTGGLLLALPCFLLTWLLMDGGTWPQAISTRNALAIGYLAVFGSVIGFVLYYYALKRLSAGAMGMISLITPVLALQLGQWINDEQVPAPVWVGTAVILLGLGLYQWSPRARPRAREGLAATS